MTGVTNRSPRNRHKRAARIEHWNKAFAEGQKFQPRRVISKSARYDWLRAIMTSDLSSTTRLVCHTLAFHGLANGTGIYPTIRCIGAEARLSERAVCDHIDLLVRRGWMLRNARRSNTTAGAVGFEYLLCIPAKPDSDRAEGRSAPLLKQTQHLNGEALNVAQHDAAVLNVSQQRVEPDAEGVEHGSKMC